MRSRWCATRSSDACLRSSSVTPGCRVGELRERGRILHARQRDEARSSDPCAPAAASRRGSRAACPRGRPAAARGRCRARSTSARNGSKTPALNGRRAQRVGQAPPAARRGRQGGAPPLLHRLRSAGSAPGGRSRRAAPRATSDCQLRVECCGLLPARTARPALDDEQVPDVRRTEVAGATPSRVRAAARGTGVRPPRLFCHSGSRRQREVADAGDRRCDTEPERSRQAGDRVPEPSQQRGIAPRRARPPAPGAATGSASSGRPPRGRRR